MTKYILILSLFLASLFACLPSKQSELPPNAPPVPTSTQLPTVEYTEQPTFIVTLLVPNAPNRPTPTPLATLGEIYVASPYRTYLPEIER